MHKLTFYPLGNADCCLIELQCGQDILIDFAATKEVGDDDDPRCDLPKLLKEHLKSRGKDHFDIVAFSHLDKDHFQGSTDFFYLQHAKKYQGNDRKHIKTMWVPAALITEKSPDDDEAVILQKEARYRFRNGRDIRVFSRPERLRKWCEENDVDLDERLDLITDAGELVPEFNIREHDAEFFVHSPFAVRQNEHTVEDRNEDSLVLHLTIDVDGIQTKSLLLADSTHEVLAQIVDITKSKGNRKRLEWDILKKSRITVVIFLLVPNAEQIARPRQNKFPGCTSNKYKIAQSLFPQADQYHWKVPTRTKIHNHHTGKQLDTIGMW